MTDQLASCTTKKRYSDEQVARDVARSVWFRRGVSLRVYACSLCGGWHLTKLDAQPVMRPGWRPPAPSKELKARWRRSDRRRHK